MSLNHSGPEEDGTWRIVYRVDEDAVIVIHMFSKKGRRTPKAVIDPCRERLKAYDGSVINESQ